MKRVFCLLIFCGSGLSLFSQSDSVALVSNIRTAANSMLESFKNKDFNSFVKYNNPNLVAMMGGENEFAGYLREEISGLKNVVFSEMKAGSVLRLVTNGKPLQCIVEQLSELIINGQPVSSVSHLIGISIDAGKTWHFADANTASAEEIKSIIPELSPLILIPRKKQENGVHLATLLKTYHPEY